MSKIEQIKEKERGDWGKSVKKRRCRSQRNILETGWKMGISFICLSRGKIPHCVIFFPVGQRVNAGSK